MGALGNLPLHRQAFFCPVFRKLRSLGVDSDTELDAVLDRIKVRADTRRGEDIRAPRKNSVAERCVRVIRLT